MPSVKVPAQSPPAAVPTAAADSGWFYYALLAVLIAGLAAAVVWMMRTKKTAAEADARKNKKAAGQDAWDTDAVDAEKEMEWYRKNQKAVGKKEKSYPKKLPKTGKVLTRKAIVEPAYEEVSIERKVLEDKVQKIQFAQFPINFYAELKASKPFEMLPLSHDPDLMSAVEQVQDEFEEDEQVRELALRILAAFKTRNSVESLGQIALYDVSANLRAKAAATLADFDHESIFENLLLACADPAREVRAAAARGLFRLSFDRADSWTRIVETKDEFRMRQAVRAASEADLVERSFDRLTHEDLKISYEAFAVTILLIKSGETAKIFHALENHQDENVKFALLHVLAVVKDETTLPNLFDLLDNPKISGEVKQKTDEVIKSFELVPA